MHATPFQTLEPRRLLSAAAATTGDFSNDWQKAQDIISGKAFIAWGDANKDRRLSYDEQFARYKSDTNDANDDGRIDVNDLRVPDRALIGDMPDAIKYMDHVDLYESGRTGGAHAWVNGDGVMAISGKGDMRVELSGKYIKYSEAGAQLARFTLKSVNRIDVFGSSSADTIRIGDVGKPVIVYARGGKDTVYGGAGGETIYGGTGDDQLHGGGGADNLVANLGDDRLWGDSGDDRLDGGGGKDHLDGGSGKNRLTGGGSVDYLTLHAKDKHDTDASDKLTMI